MAVYSCHYPIIYTFPTAGANAEYYIYLLNGSVQTQIFYGFVTAFNPGENIAIDISPIFREYMETFYEGLISTSDGGLSLPISDNKGSIMTFLVNGGTEVTYHVKYDYNTDYKVNSVNAGGLPDAGNLNEPIKMDVDPRQNIYSCGYNVAGADAHSYLIASTGASGTYTGNDQAIHMYQVNLTNKGLNPGDKIVLENQSASHVYTVVPQCRNRYAVYYVNKYGGLDQILCEGRATRSWNPTRTDVKLYDDRSSRMDFQQTRIHQFIDVQYELNTGWIPGDLAYRIDNLIYSPKIWVHDLDKDTITSCLMVNSTYAEKNERFDKPINYTFQIKESQQMIRM